MQYNLKQNDSKGSKWSLFWVAFKMEFEFGIDGLADIVWNAMDSMNRDENMSLDSWSVCILIPLHFAVLLQCSLYTRLPHVSSYTSTKPRSLFQSVIRPRINTNSTWTK